VRNRDNTRHNAHPLTEKAISATMISTKRSHGITHKNNGGNMRKMTVQSTAISSVGFNTDNTLEVRFSSGGTYRFFNVPQTTVEQLLSSDSIGSFFSDNISGRFRSRKVK
jgi:hypothetical protein